MLTKVVLKNFQAHKLLELDLGKFTTLTGGSNGGKSAVLRAIYALVRNESATDYVRYGQKSLSVKLYFDDGHAVEWIKGGGENKYILTTSEGDTSIFDKVGADVPDEVRSVLKLGPIFVKGGDKEFVNFHTQLEAPFIISATPGNVAKLLGELTSTSKLYAAVNEGNKKARSTNALRTTRLRDVRAVKDEVEQFSNLENQETILNSVKKLLSDSELLQNDIESLKVCVESYTAMSNKITEAKKAIDQLTLSSDIDFEVINAAVSDLTDLVVFIDKIKKVEEDILKLNKAISYLENSVRVDLNKIKITDTSLSNISGLLTKIVNLESDINSLLSNISNTKTEISNCETTLMDLFSTLDTCPTCHQELTSEAKVTIVKGSVVHATH